MHKRHTKENKQI